MDFFEELFAHIPSSLNNDKTFIKIKEALCEAVRTCNIDYDCVQTRMFISPKLFSMMNVDEFDYLSNRIVQAESSNDLCNFSLYSGDYLIRFKISKEGNRHIVSFESVYFESLKPSPSVEYKYKLEGNKGILEVWNILSDGDKYFDYKYDASLIKDGETIRKASEKDKDNDFFSRFGVPMELVREYRLNFKKYAKEINEFYSYSLTSYADNISEGNWTFKKFDSYDLLVKCINASAYIGERADAFLGLLNSKKEFFDGDYVISDNLLDNISFYTNGNVDILQSRGAVVKKVGEIYKMYYLFVSLEGIIVVDTNISNERAKKMYDSGTMYEPIDGDLDPEEFLRRIGL